MKSAAVLILLAIMLCALIVVIRIYRRQILAVELSESEKEIYLPVAEYLKTHDTIRNSDVQHLLNRGDSTSNRYLKRLVELVVLIPEGNKKGRGYKRAPGDKS